MRNFLTFISYILIRSLYLILSNISISVKMVQGKKKAIIVSSNSVNALHKIIPSCIIWRDT